MPVDDAGDSRNVPLAILLDSEGPPADDDVAMASSADAVATLTALIEELEEDIKRRPDPRVARLVALKRARAEFPGGDKPRQPRATTNAAPGANVRKKYYPAPPLAVVQAREPRPGSKRFKFRQVVGALIDSMGGKAPRQAILAHVDQLKTLGNTVHLDHAVSKYLTNDGTFVTDGFGTWQRRAPAALERQAAE